MNSRPEPTQSGERFGSVGAGIDKHGIVVQRAEAGIEVIAVGVDQMERGDRDSQFGHGGAKLFDAGLGRTKAVAGIDAGPVRVPKEVAMAFQVVGAEIDFDDLETALRVVHGVHTPGSHCSAGSVSL